MEEAVVQLPRWRSYKNVYADKIVEILSRENFSTDKLNCEWILACGGRIHVTRDHPDLLARGVPVVGDYFVQYEDGYVSWSPAKAFEDGYMRIE